MKLFFTSPMCFKCKLKKKEFDEQGVEYKEIDITTDEGYELAKKYNVSSLPEIKDVENEH